MPLPVNLNALDETKPDGNSITVAQLPSYHQEERRYLKGWADVEHDLATGQHQFPYGNTAGRPASPAAGQIYFNTDNQFVEQWDGAAWQPRTVAAPSIIIFGGYRVSGLKGFNNSIASGSKYDFNADLVVLRNPGDGSIIVRTNTGTLTCDTSINDVNGRDQAGVFGASQFIHFYFIWNGTLLRSLCSTTAPPAGPTMPNGYTHWAYAGSVFWTNGSALLSTFWRGAMAYIAQVTIRPLSVGTGAEQAYNLNGVAIVNVAVPPNNLGALVIWNTNPVEAASLRGNSGGPDLWNPFSALGGNSERDTLGPALIPLAAQTLYFVGTAAANHVISLLGYKMPNGGE